MDKSISSFIETNVVTVHNDDTIETVERVLETNGMSCVPVVDMEGKCFGVICSPDLIRFHAAQGNAKRRLAWEICTHSVFEASSDISVRDAAKLMTSNKVHHIVVTEQDVLKGIISSIDIIEAYLLGPAE